MIGGTIKMLMINHLKFRLLFEKEFKKDMTLSQIKNFKFLLCQFETTCENNISHIAYMLATVYHETE